MSTEHRYQMKCIYVSSGGNEDLIADVISEDQWTSDPVIIL